MHLKIKPFNNSIKSLYENHGNFHDGDAGIDLFVIEKQTIQPGETTRIHLGIACENAENKPYLFIITKPRLFNEPISEDMDLKELFQLYSIGSITPDINDIAIKKTADMLLRKYNNISDITSSTGVMVTTFCDILHEHSISFYEDLILIAQMNKDNIDIEQLNA